MGWQSHYVSFTFSFNCWSKSESEFAMTCMRKTSPRISSEVFANETIEKIIEITTAAATDILNFLQKDILPIPFKFTQKDNWQNFLFYSINISILH